MDQMNLYEYRMDYQHVIRTNIKNIGFYGDSFVWGMGLDWYDLGVHCNWPAMKFQYENYAGYLNSPALPSKLALDRFYSIYKRRFTTQVANFLNCNYVSSIETGGSINRAISDACSTNDKEPDDIKIFLLTHFSRDNWLHNDPKLKDIYSNLDPSVFDPATEIYTAAHGGRVPAAYGGIMDSATGRRAYGLGSIFKKIKKGAKKLFKSPIAKAALLYGLGTYLGGTKMLGHATGKLSAWERFKNPGLLKNLISPSKWFSTDPKSIAGQTSSVKQSLIKLLNEEKVPIKKSEILTKQSIYSSNFLLPNKIS